MKKTKKNQDNQPDLNPKILSNSSKEEWFEKIFNHSHDAIFILDIEKSIILDVNPSACEMLGYPYEELINMPISKIHPDEMDMFNRFFEKVNQEGTGWTNELTCLTQRGTILPAEISASRGGLLTV